MEDEELLNDPSMRENKVVRAWVRRSARMNMLACEEMKINRELMQICLSQMEEIFRLKQLVHDLAEARGPVRETY